MFFINPFSFVEKGKSQIGQAASQVQSWEKAGWGRERDNAYDWQDGEGYGEREHRDDGERDFPEFQFTEPSLAAKAALGFTGAACMLSWAAFWLLISLWLYQAAAKAEMNSLFWLFFGLMANVFAAILFGVVRSFIRKKCPSCGHYQPVKNHWCTKCGTALKRKCHQCGEDCELDEIFCHSCGSKMEEDKQ